LNRGSRGIRSAVVRLPEWIRTKAPPGVTHATRRLLRTYGLSTVCEEARCPNIAICFSKPTATFLILGTRCTRNCGFCSVESSMPVPPDPSEPERTALASQSLGLRYVVITSVTRDDLPDGGSRHFAQTVRAIRNHIPDAGIEVLVPDFKGDAAALKVVLDSSPDVFNHNVETVPRLYTRVRPQADYQSSLDVLKRAKQIVPQIPTKSGLMVGLGETYEEVMEVIKDIRSAGCDFLTIGQYLRPTRRNLPVVEYVPPGIFERFRDASLLMGFRAVISSPLARSSMNAEEMAWDRREDYQKGLKSGIVEGIK
jgi:lipoic acid synthetase